MVENELAVRAEHAGDLLHRFDPGAHGLSAPFVEELSGPGWRLAERRGRVTFVYFQKGGHAPKNFHQAIRKSFPAALFARGRARTALGVRPVCELATFSSISPLPSSLSASVGPLCSGPSPRDPLSAALYTATTGLSDFPAACRKGLSLIAFPLRPAVSHTAGAAGTSWFPRQKFPGMPQRFLDSAEPDALLRW